MSEKLPQPSNSPGLNADLQALKAIISAVAQKHQIPFEEIISLLKEKTEVNNHLFFPSSIVRYTQLGVLQAVCKYLKEEQSMTYHEIGQLLKRDDRVVWATYNNAIKKVPTKLLLSDQNVMLPLSILTDKNKGPLQSIVAFLKDARGMRFSDIAKLLDRDNRVVWTVYHRKKKT